MKKQLNETKRIQHLAGIQINENPLSPDKRMLELIKMYVDNYTDDGMSAEAALNKIDELLQGQLDGYDRAFMAGEEDLY
jgi:hypothetical protein